MTRIIYNNDIMKIMSLFETVTQAKLKDCIFDERIMFIVEENQIGKAIGKNGVNVRKIEFALNKKVKIVEFSNDHAQFIKNLVYPLMVKEVKEENNLITIVGGDTKTRGILIGRDAKNLKELEYKSFAFQNGFSLLTNCKGY